MFSCKLKLHRKDFNYNRLARELLFVRDNPFYDDWEDWQQCAHDWQCPRIFALSKAINKGHWHHYDVDQFSRIENDMVIDIQCLVGEYNRTLSTDEDYYEMFHKVRTAQTLRCSCWLLEGQESLCEFKEIHYKAHYIALMWSFIDNKLCPRKMKKYYKRLERVILALPMKRLSNLMPEFITQPAVYRDLGRHLMFQLYRRTYLDTLVVRRFADCCEQVKGRIAVQQGGAYQSLSPILDDQLFERLRKVVELEDPTVLLQRFYRVRQQGLFSFTHKHDHDHRVNDESLQKIKDLLDESREAFMSSLASSLVLAGKNLMAVFAVATTVVVLAKSAAGIAFKILLGILHLLYGMIFGEESVPHLDRVRQQGGDLEDNLSVPFLPSMLLKFVIGAPDSMMKKLWRNPNIDLVMRRISYFGDPKVHQGVDRITEWIVSVLNRTRSWFYRQIGISVPEDITSDSHAIMAWNEEVDDLLKQYYKNEFVWSETSWSVLYNLYARGLTFTRSRMYNRWHYDVFRVINKLGNILEQFKQHQREGQSIRNPPVTIYLTGGTGVGKSSVTYPLAVEILKSIFEREGQVTDLHRYWKSMIYMRSAEQEFWDGYENQFVTVFDDFNQQADSTANPNLELFEIIRASNCFPYPLHMASLDQKATTTFTSKIILVSSNLEKPKTQSLNFPEALTRRFDICVKVSRKEGYTGRLSRFDPKIYDFNLYNMATNEDLGRCTYEELVKACSDEYFARCSFVDSIDSYIESIFEPVSDIPVQQSPMGLPKMEQAETGDDVINTLMEETRDIIDSRVRSALSNNFKRNVEMSIARRRRTMWNLHAYDSTYPYEDRPLYRRAWDWLRGHTPDLWGEARAACDRLKGQYEQMVSAWASFREQHPYIFRSIMVVGFIVGALVFLKMFMKLSSMISGKTAAVTAKQEHWRAAMHTTADQTVVGTSTELPVLKTVKAEAYTPGVVRTVKAEAYTPGVVRTVKAESVIYDPVTGLPSAQGVKDLSATEMLSSLVRRNMYKMYESTQNTPIGHCLFLKGKVALMPRHFMYAFKQSLANDPDAKVVFTSPLLQRSFEIYTRDFLKEIRMIGSPEEEFGPPVTRDLMAVLVDSSIVHPDITPMFATRHSLERVGITEVVLPVYIRNNVKGSDVPVLVFRYSKGQSVLQRIAELPIGTDEKEVIRYVRDAWRYTLDTQQTECGAPLIVRNNQINPGKICGMHIAGLDGTGEGFSCPVYQDEMKKILSMFPEKAVMGFRIRMDLEGFPKEQGQVPKEAQFVRLGALKNPVYQPTKSKIVPSYCFDKIKAPETKPCQLRPTKDFDPRAYRLGRLGNIPHAIQRDVIRNSAAAFLDECSEVIERGTVDSNVVKSVYTFEEAVLGIPGEPYVNSIKRETSPGFPYIANENTKNRKNFFGSGMDYDLSGSQCKLLRKNVEEIINSAKQGIVLDHYFVDTLKDERKPIHKAHKTRLFSAGPLDYLVASKMYFNGVVALLQKNRNWSHVSVGTNPYSEDWSEIARSLIRKSNLMVAGDFEGFDASQHQCLLEQAGEVFVQLAVRHLGARPEDVTVMRVLLVSLFNSLHISGKEVYQWTHSLPSGHYLTAPINSVFVNVVFGCIWQLAYDKVSYMQARSFWNECGIVAYGDDHIVSIPSNRIDIFNQLTVPEFFQRIGLSYTMEDKDAVATRPYRRLDEISYLKRSFCRDENGEWLAPLSLSTVLETPMWMHENPDPVAQTIANLEWAVKELSLHSEDVWSEWFPVLETQMKELGHRTIFCRQMEVREVVKSDGCDLAFL